MFLVLIITVVHFIQCNEYEVNDVEAVHNEVTTILFHPGMLNDSAQGEIRYTVSLLSSPDLPSWLHWDYSASARSGTVFGTPPANITHVQLKAVLQDMTEFTSRVLKLQVNYRPATVRRRYEVQLKIDNIRVTDLFRDDRLRRLFAIFEQVLWPGSAESGVRLSRLAGAATVSAASPLPADAAGVLLRVAAPLPFSRRLHAVQREVRPLWRRGPCPRNFRRASVERHFRHAGFRVDWCRFQLFDGGALVNDAGTTSVEPTVTTSSDLPAGRHLPRRQLVPRRQLFNAWLSACSGPALLALILCSCVTLAMCSSPLPRSDDSCRASHQLTSRDRRSPSLSSCAHGSLLRRSVLRDLSPQLTSQRSTPHPHHHVSPIGFLV